MPTIDNNSAIDTIIVIIWAVFWVGWFAAAIGVKHGRSRWGQFVGFRIAAAVILILVLNTKIFKGLTVNKNTSLQGVGLAIVIAGLALAVWARLYLGRNWGG